MHPFIRILATASALAFVGVEVAQAASAGQIEFVDGDVQVMATDGKAVKPVVGATVYEGDSIKTGADAVVHLRMADQMLIAVRPNTQMRIDAFRALGDADDNVAVSLISGTFRAITGWIGRHNRARYAVNMPSITIGIRGTDHEPAYYGADTTAAQRNNQPPGAYDKVNLGETVMKNAKGETSVSAGHAAFAPHDASSAPAALEKVPAFYKAGKNESAFEAKREEQAKQLDAKRAEAQKKAKEERKEAEKKATHKRHSVKRETH